MPGAFFCVHLIRTSTYFFELSSSIFTQSENIIEMCRKSICRVLIAAGANSFDAKYLLRLSV